MALSNDRSGRPTVGRRGFLVGLVGTSTLLAGCTADPRIGGTEPSGPARPTGAATLSAEPSPTPSFADSAPGAAIERRLAATAAGIARHWRDDLDENRPLVEAIARAHLVHAEALTSADPTARAVPPSPSPSAPKPKQGTLDDALGDLVSAERAAATGHRQRALAATGFSALLWASMGAAATAYADALQSLGDPTASSPAFGKTPEPHALPVLSDTEASQDLVRQLHAIVYGYQVAIGQLAAGGTKDAGLSRLQALRTLRDSLIAQLRARRAEVPVAAAAYVPSVEPTSAATAAQLIRRMERALLPYVGLWLATGPQPAGRSTAYAALLATDAAARSFDAGLLTWPGWNG